MEGISSNLATYGYLFLFFYSLGGGLIVLLVAAVLSSTGNMDIFIIFFTALTANFLGDNLLFYLSKYNRKDIYPYLKKHRRKLAFSRALMKQHGSLVIFIQKFIYGVKTLVPIAIGLTSYSFKKFIFYNIFASLLWAVVVSSAGYFGGRVFIDFYENIFKGNPIIAPMLLVVILGLTWLYLSKKTKKN